jgi:hypothetical protein
MQPVPAPAWRLTGARAPWLALAAGILLLGIAVALLGADSGAPAATPSARSDLALIGGKPLQQASCAEWRTATPDERAAVIATLKRNVGAGTPYGPGTTLSAADAYALFERACARPYADGFLLYQIYTRAAAFQSTPQHFQ